jgi:hypothetical protein
MAERKMNGADILFFIDPAGGTAYDMVVCLTNQSLGITTDEIDAATKCGPDTQPGKQKNSLSIEGQVMASPGTDRISVAALYTLAQNKTQFSWKYGPATPVTGDPVYTGKGFFSSLEQSADLDNPAGFTASVGVIGDVLQVVTA